MNYRAEDKINKQTADRERRIDLKLPMELSHSAWKFRPVATYIQRDRVWSVQIHNSNVSIGSYHLRQAGYVMSGVCWFVCFVCLSVCLYVKTTELVFRKILSQMYLWSKKNGLNFGSNPPADDPDPGMFGSFFQHFSTIWLIS